VNDARLGLVFRSVRVRRGWRQQDVADRAGVSRSEVSLIERGLIDGVPLRTLRRIAGALEINLEIVARWRGAEIDRLMNAGHAQLHEELATYLGHLPGWLHRPEVSFSIWGERGVIDILAFHEPSGSLLVIELKTELANIEELLTEMGRRQRLATEIAAGQGWKPTSISTWIVIAESDANRRAVRRHAAVLHGGFPADGHAMRSWLRRPVGSIHALSFWGYASGRNATQRLTLPKRVRRPGIGRAASLLPGPRA
jgi:transcriptional regulator with XRE-family HTH domain